MIVEHPIHPIEHLNQVFHNRIKYFALHYLAVQRQDSYLKPGVFLLSH